MNRWAHHKYTWSKPFTSVRHNWEIIGPGVGVNFHVSVSETPDYPDGAGLELHSGKPTGDCAPSQTDCWLLKTPCWHDGTSLYASEHLWPRIRDYLSVGDHETIFRILEREGNDRFFSPKDEG